MERRRVEDGDMSARPGIDLASGYAFGSVVTSQLRRDASPLASP
jgi:hypothetical protein